MRNELNLNSTSHPNLLLISQQTQLNIKELEAPQATPAMLEICLDGWTITYIEFLPQKSKQAKKQISEETLMKGNSQNQQVCGTLATHGTSTKGTQH